MDELRAARGIVNAIAMSLILWALIGAGIALWMM